MSWIAELQQEFAGENVDFQSEASFLIHVFKNIMTPQIYLNGKGKICMPEKYSIEMGGSDTLVRLLSQPHLFNNLPSSVQKALLDIVFLLLSREPCDIVRLQFVDEHVGTESQGFCKIFLKLLGTIIQDKSRVSLAKRLIHLVGLAGSIGTSSAELRKVLMLLRSPSELSLSLLQCIQIMIRNDGGVSKAAPPSFFNFGGQGAGLGTTASAFPFSKEYQFCSWFRIEKFHDNDIPAKDNLNDDVQHLLSWQNPSHRGLDIYFENSTLIISICQSSKTEPLVVRLPEAAIKRGVWYHLMVRHSKPKLAFFSNDELSVSLDDEVIFSDSIRFPNLGNFVDTEFFMGKNLNGQMGPLYFFNEALSSAAVAVLAKLDSGRGHDGLNMTSDCIPTDLHKGLTTNDKKFHALGSKVSMSYHPLRCYQGYALDIHGGRHALMGNVTQPWNIVNPRDLLAALGGINCLLPLFPRLLIEASSTANDVDGNSKRSTPVQFNTTGAASNSSVTLSLNENWDDDRDNAMILEGAVQQLIRQRKEELVGDGCLSLLLNILSKCIVNHKSFQQELFFMGGVEMIEYALSCMPSELLINEGEKCVLSLLQFKNSAVDLPALEWRITKSLMCNIDLWYGASFHFLSSLMSVMLASLKAKPEVFLKLIGIQTILDGLEYFVGVEDEEKAYSDVVSHEGKEGPLVSTPVGVAPTSPSVDAPTSQFSKTPGLGVILEESENTDSEKVNSSVLFSPLPPMSAHSSDMSAKRRSSFIEFNKNPRTSITSANLKSSMRKLKSFKLALSERLQDDEEEDFEAEAELLEHSHQDLFQLAESSEVGEGVTSSKRERRKGSFRMDFSSSAADSDNFGLSPMQPLGISTPNNQVADADQELSTFNESHESIIPPQTNAQRKQIRENMESMLIILILQGSTEKEVIPFFDYIATCKDKVVVNELAQILLFLIMEGGPKIISAIINACNGVEEFATFILLYLVHQPLEDLRYSGIRILTHFYARVDQASSVVLSMSLKRKKRSLAKALGGVGANSNQGLQRLQVCGGMALLCELISAHCKDSSEMTYAALLEMLLTKPGSIKNSNALPLSDVFEANFVGGNGFMGNAQAIRQRTASFFNSPPSSTSGTRGQVQFAAHYLSMDNLHDESEMTNNVVLPVFFELLPKLPIGTQEQIYTDLVALLKHSYGNRQAFYTCPSWHLCMFNMVIQLMNNSNSESSVQYIHTGDIISELEIWNGTAGAESPTLLQIKQRSRSRLSSDGELLRTWTGSEGEKSPLSFQSVSANKQSQDSSQVNLFFDLGMKIYSTLLLHAVENKNGWKEVDLCIAPSLESDCGYSVVQSVVSHFLNELTFNMKSKYKELQKLIKSTNSVEHQLATDKLENVLCILITASQIALEDQQCVCPFTNFQVNKLRALCFGEIARDLYLKKLEARGSDTKNIIHDYDLGAFTQMEIRQLFAEAEIRLISRLERKSTVAVSTTTNNNNNSDSISVNLDESDFSCESTQQRELNCDEFIDFNYVWQDISGDSELNKLRTSSIDSTNAPTSLKSIEELLHPLARVHDESYGRLILVLQGLRFFDVIFWPTPESPIRNIEMLRFSKETVQSGKMDLNKRASFDGGNPRLQMSVFSSAMRMCIFSLNKLSPITHLAVLNIKRLRAMIVSLDRVSMYNTPTYDWMLTSITHVTINIQRLILAVAPVYAMIGLDTDFQVRSVGPWEDSFDEFDKLNNFEATKIYEAMDSRELKYKLQSYFNCSMGRNIIRNIRCSLRFLSDIFEAHSSKLQLGLEERTYNALYVLVEQIKADSQMKPISSSLPPKRSTVPRQFSFKWEDNVEMDAAYTDTGSNFPSRSSSISEQSDASEYSNSETVEQQSEQPSTFEDAFSGYDIVVLLKWLRYPYFTRNPFRSVQVVKALDALDYLEGRNVNKFMTECKGLKQSMEELQDVAVKSVEEMTELKELSREVYEIMVERSELRFLQSKTQLHLKTKNVANRWHECLQEFEADWSPWRISLNQTWDEILQGDEERSVAHYEVTKHRDKKMRNMLLTRLPEPLNHKNVAYMESRLRDQLNYVLTHGDENSMTAEERSQALAVVNGSNTESSMLSSRSTLPFKLTQPVVNSKGNKEIVWDDDDDETRTVDSETSSSLTGGLASFATFFQGQERRPAWTYLFNWGSDEKILTSFEVTQILVDQAIGGVLLLTNRCLYFHCKRRINPNAYNQSKPFFDRRWFLDRLTEVYGRRYLLQNCAIELFFADSAETFFAFKSLAELQKFFRVLRNQSTPLLSTARTLNPRHAFKNSPWTELWRKRLISNFEYLMRLNIISGRSYNDITQYPVFPWVIADYTSEELNIKDAKIYRKLNLPMGALNQVRLQEFLDRYKSFDDDTVPKFMYGSHYSSAGVIMHYMIRQEPFTTLAIALQGGRFDCPDRLFFDMRRSWQGVNNSMSDVKELIPELFCCPEILMNSNRLPLGELQEGGEVDHVVLPPWAKTAFDFIRINREALESEYVSEHLHEWIDLIFGFKQTGQAAKDANNVFYYLTYEGAINIEAIEDPLQREAAKAQVIHFGQTPSQLLQKEHPRRLPKDDCVLPLCANIVRIPLLRSYTPSGTRQIGRTHGPIIAIRCVGDKIVTFHSDFGIGYYRWIVTPDLAENLPFTIRIDKVKHLPTSTLSAAENLLRGHHLFTGSNHQQSSSQILPSFDRSTSINGDVEANSSPLPQQGVLSSWRSAFKGFSLSVSSTVGSPGRPEDRPAGTLYNAMRIERKSRSIPALQIEEPGQKSSPSLRPHVLNTTTAITSSFKHMTPNNVSIFLPDILSQGRIFTCGYWDNTLKLHNLDTMKEVASSSSGHLGGITCMQQGSCNNNMLITGGNDGTLRIWAVEKPSLATMVLQNHLCTETITDDMVSVAAIPDNIFSTGLECIHTLWGHISPIQSISYSSDLDIVLSGGSDGLLCVHTAHEGSYIRSMVEMVGSSVDVVYAASSGYLFAHSWATLQLSLYWMNGQHLKTITNGDKIECMAIAGTTGNILVCGTSTGRVTFSQAWSLEEIHYVDLHEHGAVKCLWFSEDQQFLFAGSNDGSFSVITDTDKINSSNQKSLLTTIST